MVQPSVSLLILQCGADMSAPTSFISSLTFVKCSLPSGHCYGRVCAKEGERLCLCVYVCACDVHALAVLAMIYL